jgi:hypothetical protein
MFHCFNQNNSGGRFRTDHARGISHYVIVEGNSREDIIERAQDIGLYFDGCRTGRDCSCCGDRWYKPWEGTDLTDTPMIYGEDVSSGVYNVTEEYGTAWITDGAEGYIHYANNVVQPVVYTKVPKDKKKTASKSLPNTRKRLTASK